jgi:hypothetical protein
MLSTSFWCSLKSILWSLVDISPWDSNSLFANLKFSCSIYWISRFLTTRFRDFGRKDTRDIEE